jgi:hypothetical protein
MTLSDAGKGALTAAKRKKLKKSQFGQPGKSAYPIENKSHAADAKARASEMYNKGRLSASAKAQIDARANRVLARKGA